MGELLLLLGLTNGGMVNSNFWSFPHFLLSTSKNIDVSRPPILSLVVSLVPVHALHFYCRINRWPSSSIMYAFTVNVFRPGCNRIWRGFTIATWLVNSKGLPWQKWVLMSRHWSHKSCHVLPVGHWQTNLQELRYRANPSHLQDDTSVAPCFSSRWIKWKRESMAPGSSHDIKSRSWQFGNPPRKIQNTWKPGHDYRKRSSVTTSSRKHNSWSYDIPGMLDSPVGQLRLHEDAVDICGSGRGASPGWSLVPYIVWVLRLEPQRDVCSTRSSMDETIRISTWWLM